MFILILAPLQIHKHLYENYFKIIQVFLKVIIQTQYLYFKMFKICQC